MPSEPEAPCPNAAMKKAFPTVRGSVGRVAPAVTKGTPARCATGPAASASVESFRPPRATTRSFSINLLTARTTAAGLLRLSAAAICTRRPRTPPRALICAAARRIPASPGEPIDLRPPVSLKTAPIRIGSDPADAPRSTPPNARTNTAAMAAADARCAAAERTTCKRYLSSANDGRREAAYSWAP
jgi:hypothetical protein